MGSDSVRNDPLEGKTRGSQPEVTVEPVTDKDVFICYNSADQRDVEVIYFTLRGFGLEVWYDRRDLDAGVVASQLENAIQRAKAAAVIIGPSGLGDWQASEYPAILTRRIKHDGTFRLVPVVLPNVPPDKVPAFLDSFAKCEFTSTLNDKIARQRLYESLTGREWHNGAYEIHVEVEDPNVTCFAAVPGNAPPSVLNAIECAVVDVNDQLQTAMEFRHQATDSAQLNRGKLDRSKPATYALIRRKAARVWLCTGESDERREQNWSDAEQFVEHFYENIVPAIEEKSSAGIRGVMEALRANDDVGCRYHLLDCFEACLLIYFLDPETLDNCHGDSATLI